MKALFSGVASRTMIWVQGSSFIRVGAHSSRIGKGCPLLRTPTSSTGSTAFPERMLRRNTLLSASR